MRSSVAIHRALAAAVVLALLGTGCGEDAADRVLAIEATGTVVGLVYYDTDGDRIATQADIGLSEATVHLVLAGTRDTTASGSSDIDGVFSMTGVPVGAYELAIDRGPAGDSLIVAAVEGDAFTLGADDTATVVVALSYPFATVGGARTLPVGTRVFVEGIALNAPTTFGDSTVHLAGAGGFIRVVRLRALGGFTAGDRMRFVATTGREAGQPVLIPARTYFIGVDDLPAAEAVSTASAARADGGRLDAGLVSIAGAAITDTATTIAGEVRLDVDDGSGPLVVVLDPSAIFNTARFAPGDIIEATGLLVPDEAGGWWLKPRSDTEIRITGNGGGA